MVLLFAYGLFIHMTYHDEPSSALVPLGVTLCESPTPLISDLFREDSPLCQILAITRLRPGHDRPRSVWF